jgi:hypothetical protein
MTTTRTTHDHYTLDEMKNDRDNYLLPRWRQDTKKGDDSKKWKVPRQLLIVLCLLVVVGRLFIIIIIVTADRNMRGVYAKSS